MTLLPTHSNRTEGPGTEPGREDTTCPHEDRIRRLQRKANRGLLAMALFIAVSIGAIRHFDVLPPLPDRIRDLLGAPPSPQMIGALLIVYSFSAIVLVLARMMSGSGSYSGMAHVGYLTVFYAFYHVAGALEENFWAVFAAGMTILCLEGYHVWTWCMEEIARERLPKIDR